LFSVYGIAITDQILRRFVHTAGLDQLLRCPGGCWMVGYIEMQYPTTVIAENDEHKKDFETGGWDREKIERDEFFRMILQECSPVL
jgi:hypothetical protein